MRETRREGRDGRDEMGAGIVLTQRTKERTLKESKLGLFATACFTDASSGRR